MLNNEFTGFLVSNEFQNKCVIYMRLELSQIQMRLESAIITRNLGESAFMGLTSNHISTSHHKPV